MNIAGSKALLTGASSGIGAATARAPAACGAAVALLARTASALEKIAGKIRAAGGNAQAFPVDAADWRAVDALAPRLFAEFGEPDIVVNSAGAGRWLFTEETHPAEAVAMMGAPYFAAFFVIRVCLPAVRAVEYNQREVVLPFMLHVFFLVNKLFLRFTEWPVVSTGHRHA